MSSIERNVAVDVLRGLAIVIMIIVDAPPDFEVTYPLLLHSEWEGITLADLAFPGFVFTMGASATYSISRRQNEPLEVRLIRVLRRTLILFMLGLIFNIVPEMISGAEWNLRVFGILQRLALTYAVGMVIINVLRQEKLILIAAFMLLIISAAGFHIYAPTAPFDKMHNISQALDLLIPGAVHCYQYYGLPFEPEGLYGTFSSAALMLFGAIAGSFEMRKARRLLPVAGVILLVIGLMWSRIDIISKPLWTAPFTLINAGADIIVLAIITWLMRRVPRAKMLLSPFQAFGTNPLLFFMATNFALIMLRAIDGDLYLRVWRSTIEGFISPAFSAALYSVIWCLLWLPLAEFLFKSRFIVKI